MTFKIEKGVPLPSRGAALLYPFADMEPGDSFTVPVSMNRTAESVRASVTSSARKFARAQQGEWNFVTAVERKEGGGTGCAPMARAAEAQSKESATRAGHRPAADAGAGSNG